MSTTESGSWPSIPLDDWLDTRDTLHLFTQIVGKVRLANEPLINHWWNSTLYVAARGLTTLDEVLRAVSGEAVVVGRVHRHLGQAATKVSVVDGPPS